MQEQPRPIAFVDEDERVTSHRFDFLSRFTDGRRIAFEVKPAEKAERHRWKERLTLIAAQSDGLADGYGLLTERELTPTLVANATLILAVRRDPRPDHDAIVRAIVRRALGQMRIADIVAASGLGGDGFRAVARLIDAGELSLVDRVRIDYPAWVVLARRPGDPAMSARYFDNVTPRHFGPQDRIGLPTPGGGVIYYRCYEPCDDGHIFSASTNPA